MIAENITVVITLAPCSDKSESNEAWLSLVPSNPFWLKLIKYEWSLSIIDIQCTDSTYPLQFQRENHKYYY